MRPEEIGERTVRVVRLVRELMMPAMNGDPMRRRVLDRADRQRRGGDAKKAVR